MDSDLALLERQRDQRAVVLAFLAELPKVKMTLDETEEVFVFNAADRQDFELRGCFLLQFTKPFFELLSCLCVKELRRIDNERTGIANRHFAPGHGGTYGQDERHERCAKLD